MKYLKSFNESINGVPDFEIDPNSFDESICKLIPNEDDSNYFPKATIMMDSKDILAIEDVVESINQVCRGYGYEAELTNNYNVFINIKVPLSKSETINCAITKQLDEYYICEIYNDGEVHYLTFQCDQLEGLRDFGKGFINELKKIIS